MITRFRPRQYFIFEARSCRYIKHAIASPVNDDKYPAFRRPYTARARRAVVMLVVDGTDANAGSECGLATDRPRVRYQPDKSRASSVGFFCLTHQSCQVYGFLRRHIASLSAIIAHLEPAYNREDADYGASSMPSEEISAYQCRACRSPCFQAGGTGSVSSSRQS